MLPEIGESDPYPRTFDSSVTVPREHGDHLDLNLSYAAPPAMSRVPNMFVGSSSDATRNLFDASRLVT
jgi:hypothetical protein